DRRNAARMEQRKKQQDVVANARLFQGMHATPKIVAVIPLCEDVDTRSAVQSLFASIGEVYSESGGAALLAVERFKQRIQFVPVGRHLLEILDALKVADLVIFLLSANVEVDEFGEKTMTTIRSQGVPGVMCMAQFLDAHPQKRQLEIRKSLGSYMSHHFPGDHRLFAAGDANDCLSALRYITSVRPKPIVWRDRHPYMVSEGIEFDANEGDEVCGTLRVTGFVRGSKLSANNLVHIPNFGDYQVSMITASPSKQRSNDMVDVEPVVLQLADPNRREDLVSENDPDPMEGEQTWPTEEEIAEADGEWDAPIIA
ncbi:NUC121 domain-containing protein, partial [Entophlyctis helioformis]